MLAAFFAVMRYQHVDSLKMRDLMRKLIGEARLENRELIEQSNKELREAIDKNREAIDKNRESIVESSKEHREPIEKVHMELSGGLNEVRERLSWIEGYLRRWPSPPNDGDAQAA